MEPARKFKIIVNSKECGTCSGSSPSTVAKKVVKKLCGSSSKVVKFSLKECKRGCERVCGPYQGRMEKLDRPYKRSGKTITHRVVCGKVRKMRGGVLGKDGELLSMDDFEVKVKENKDDLFLRLETIGKLGFLRLGRTKEQYAFFNPIKLNNNEQNRNNNEQNRNNNEQNQAGTEQMNQQTNENPIYYQYVAIRKLDKSVVFRELKESNNISDEFDISKIDTSILLKLLNKIKKEIEKKRETKKDFDARSIVDTLEEYLKDKIKSNLKNDTVSWKIFKIEEENPPAIKYFSFGTKTSKFGGNKNQYIFFDIVELYSHHFFYQYVVIRDENQKISLKKIVINENGVMEILDFGTFDSVRSDKSGKGQLILEKLHRDILILINNSNSPESSNFATTIRDKLSNYTSGDKETELVPDSFEKNMKKDQDEFAIDGKYVFFNDIFLLVRREVSKNKGLKLEYTNEEYEFYTSHYMYVMFLDKEKKINFKKLIIFKDTFIIAEIDMRDIKILELLYRKINHLCDSKNNEHLFNILFALEEHVVHQKRKLLKSRDFYITSQQQEQTIRILSKNKKTLIFFKRLNGPRKSGSNNEFILYEYAIIIDEDTIQFYRSIDPQNRNKPLSVLIERITEINIDDIDVLLLTLLYEELIQRLSGNNNNNNNNNLKRLRKLLYQKIGKFFDFKQKVEEILESKIHNKKISVNGAEHEIEYDGTFTFNFFDNPNNSNELKEFLRRILKKQNIIMNKQNKLKFKFKPVIESIVVKHNKNSMNIINQRMNNELPEIQSFNS